MYRFGKGLFLFAVLICLTACSQDKKLPQGERISVLDDYEETAVKASGSGVQIPVASVNRAWSQAGVSPSHVIGNLKAGTTLREQWAENFGKGISKRDFVLSAPVINNGQIFVMDTQGVVSSFALKSGKFLWSNELKANIGGFKETKNRASGLAVDRDTIFATTGFGGVFAMDTRTGAPKWRKIMESPIRIAPMVTSDALFVQTVDNNLYALDKATGKEIWRFGVAQEDTVIAGGAVPAYDEENNAVVAGFSNGEIVVLNATVGTPLWSSMLVSNKQVRASTEINTIGAYPIVQEGIIYAISNSDLLQALDMRTGDKLWEKEIGSTQNMLLSGDYLFVISNRNILYAIEKYSGDIAWTLDIRQYLKEEDDNDTKVIYAAPPLMLNGNIYLAFSNGKVLRIDAHQGQLKAKTDLEIDISNGLIAAEEYVVAVSDDADVVVFK
jgi:outer membrane protein assembly factor BamB